MKERYKHMLRLWTIRSGLKRVEYMRRHKIYHSLGKPVLITSRKVPLYGRLISIGNNVWLSSGVEFVPHDGTHFMLNCMKDGYKYTERIGCIEIGDNVWVGADVKILYDVKVGNNVIIAAGTMVNKDIPSNSVWGGVPGRKLMSFDDYLEKRRQFSLEHPADNHTLSISPECEAEVWREFYKHHEKSSGD